MKPNDPSHEEQICAMFDSFIKTVSRNFVRNLQREAALRNKHYVDMPVESFGDYLTVEESDPFDTLVLYVDGHSCVVEDETFYNALLSLPRDQRKVLLLDFWQDMNNREIAEYMGISTRTVYNLRQRAYRAIRKYYEKEYISQRNQHQPD